MSTWVSRMLAVAGTGALFAAMHPAAAQTPEEFYKGKTVTFYVGLSPGGGYDINARLTARYIGKYIPGNPQVVVRNMPGGGSLVMTNFVANVPARDGLHIGAPQRGIPLEPLLGDASNARYDALKLQWIGSTNADTSVAISTKKSGVRTWQDLKTKELVVGGTGVGTESVTVPYILRNLLGFKYKVIAGYPGGSQLNLAMQRGEIDGRGTITWTTIKPMKKEWLDSGEAFVLYQQGLKKHPDIPDVPLVTELTDDPDIKRVLKIQFTAFEMGRPYFVAEGVPADRVAALRTAFDKAMKDPELLAEAEKLQLDISPSTGAEMTELMTDIYATPKPLIARLQEASKDKPDLKVLTPPKEDKPAKE